MTALTRLRRRLRQAEKCLDDVQDILAENYVDLRGYGADEPGNAEYDLNEKITARIYRTRGRQKPLHERPANTKSF